MISCASKVVRAVWIVSLSLWTGLFICCAASAGTLPNGWVTAARNGDQALHFELKSVSGDARQRAVHVVFENLKAGVVKKNESIRYMRGELNINCETNEFIIKRYTDFSDRGLVLSDSGKGRKWADIPVNALLWKAKEIVCAMNI